MRNSKLISSNDSSSERATTQNDTKSQKQINQQELKKQIADANDGTPEYKLSVLESYRKLQYRTSIYGEVPVRVSVFDLGFIK